MGPTVRTQQMAPNMTPRVFKVQDGSVQAPTQLLPKRKPEVVQVSSTPSERIGQLYTPSAAGLSPRLIATHGPPAGRIDSNTVQLNTPRDLGEDGRVEVLLGGGPTTAGAQPPPKASHWREYGTTDENQNPSLPLEWFDQEEAEDPGEWGMSYESPKPATSRYLNNGAWEWRPCDVVKHDPETSLFTIRWKHSAAEKQVRRLNLCFDGDEEGAFEERIATAREFRKRAEDAMRLSTFVNGSPVGSMPTMTPDQVQRILESIGKDIPESNYDLMGALVKVRLQTPYMTPCAHCTGY